MRVVVMLEIHTPRKRARRQRPALRVQRRPRKCERVSGAIRGAFRRFHDRADRRLIGGDGERGGLTRGAAGRVLHDAAELRSRVGENRGGQRERGVRRPRKVGEARRGRGLTLPLITQRGRTVRGDAERRRLSDGDVAIARLRADLGRERAGVLNFVNRLSRVRAVVKTAVPTRDQVHADWPQIRREIRDDARDGIEGANRSDKTIHEKIFPEIRRGKLIRRRIVKRAARDRAAAHRIGRMRVGVESALKPRV